MEKENIRSYNIGNSDYSKHSIQPWDVWIDYALNPFDADIVKRILRKKQEPGISAVDNRKMDYEKIIHICKERIRQIESGVDSWNEFNDNINQNNSNKPSNPGEYHEALLITGNEYKCKKSHKNILGQEVFTSGIVYKAISSNCMADNCGASKVSKETFDLCFEPLEKSEK